MNETIFTIDARTNVFLETITSGQGLDSEEVYKEIEGMFKNLISVLNQKKIKYQDLKSSLIPQIQRKEIGFVFDTNLIGSNSYGHKVFEILIPLLDTRSTHSLLCGDIIGEERYHDLIQSLLFENIKSHKNINYVYSEQFYLVYINNLSETQFLNLHEGLINFIGYVGYFDLSYSSPFKTILSSMLVRAFIKNKKTVINGTEESEDVNMTGYPFEKFGYKVVGIDDILYGVFLSYKIEREILPGLENDTLFSLNALTSNVLNIYEFDIELEESKFEYLFREKYVNIKRAGLSLFSRDELASIIKSKLNQNYLYNLSHNREHGTLKFNIIIETFGYDNYPIKSLVSLEYNPSKKNLRLLTMY